MGPAAECRFGFGCVAHLYLKINFHRTKNKKVISVGFFIHKQIHLSHSQVIAPIILKHSLRSIIHASDFCLQSLHVYSKTFSIYHFSSHRFSLNWVWYKHKFRQAAFLCCDVSYSFLMCIKTHNLRIRLLFSQGAFPFTLH